MRRRGLLMAVVTVVILAVAALPASAEVFVDLYVGGAFTGYNDLESRFGSTFQNLEEVEYDASAIFGGRVGYWFETPLVSRLNFGLAVDVSYFEPDVDFQSVDGVQTIDGVAVGGTFAVLPIDISVIVVSLDLMFRWPVLVSPAFPRGRLQPYATIGPAVFFSEAEDSGGNFAPADQSDRTTTVGFKFGGGAAYYVAKNLALFGEFRLTYFSPEWDFSDGGVGGKLETDLFTSSFLVGLSVRF